MNDKTGYDLHFYYLSTPEGLAQHSVHAVVQDSDGFMWFGTQNGLNRYDGYEMALYRFEANNLNSLADNHVASLFVDSENHLWIGTVGGGLHRYDPDLDHFLRIQGIEDDPATLSDNSIWSITECRDGYLWIATSYGLNKMDRKSFIVKKRFFQIPGDAAGDTADDLSGQTTGLSSNQVNVVYADNRDNIWIGTSEGLDRLDREKGLVQYFLQKDPSLQEITALNEPVFVTSIHEDHEGFVWVGTEGKGLLQFREDESRFVSHRHDPEDPSSLAENLVYSIFEDARGMLWVGTGSKGLSVYDRKSNRFETLQPDPDRSLGLKSSSVVTIYESRDQVLWFGTYADGVAFLDRDIWLFPGYSGQFFRQNGFESSAIRAFAEDPAGQFWIGTDGQGLLHFDPENETLQIYDKDLVCPIERTLSSPSVLALLAERDHLWIGSYGGGLSRMDLKSGCLHHFRHELHNPESLSSDDVFGLYRDRYGDLWIATNGGGLNRMITETETIIRYMVDPDNPRAINNNDARSIFEDRHGNLWIGTYSGQLTLFDREKEAFRFYDINHGQPYYASVIQVFHEDRQGRFWLGTRGGGLKQYDRSRMEIVRAISVDQGLPDNLINGIVEDRGGILWLATETGLSRFDPDVGHIRNYGTSSGLPRGTFEPGSFLPASDGSALFGGSNGFTRFFPDQIELGKTGNPVVFSALYINNSPLSVAPDSRLERHINRTDRLVLSHDALMISLRFSALNFSAVRNNRFAYKLEGFDTDWNYVGTQRSLTYTNLSPGTYRLLVRATNNDGLWAGDVRTMTVTIRPPFWKTAWFLGFSGLLTVVLLAGAYNYRVYAIKERSRLLEALVEDRTRELAEINRTKDKLVSIIAHDLNNVSFRIIGYVQLIMDALEENSLEDAQELGKGLFKTTTGFSDMLKELLVWAGAQAGKDTFRPENIRLAEVLMEQVRRDHPKAESKSIRLVLSIRKNPDIMVYSDPVMLSAILRNLIDNALKFTAEGGQVEVFYKVKEGRVVVSVRDNGIGMEQELVDMILHSGSIHSRKGTLNEKGIGLGLTLTRDFIEKNGGVLTISSTPEKGSTFSFSLLPGKEP